MEHLLHSEPFSLGIAYTGNPCERGRHSYRVCASLTDNMGGDPTKDTNGSEESYLSEIKRLKASLDGNLVIM